MRLLGLFRGKYVDIPTQRERGLHETVEPPEGEVGKPSDKQIEEIEETQEALRESIAEAKKLADKAQQLLKKHKQNIKRAPG